MSRDREVRDIADQLEALLDQLSVNVQALGAILDPPEEEAAIEHSPAAARDRDPGSPEGD